METIETVGRGLVVPALISGMLMVACRRLLPERYLAPWAIATGFAAGYLLLPDWAAWWPKRHWQWLLYLAGIAAAVGPIGLAAPWVSPVRWLPRLAVSLVAASLLTPSWPDLQPPRPWCVVLLGGFLLLLTLGLEELPGRFGNRLFMSLLTAAAALVAILVAALVSLKFGHLAMITAAAFAGAAAVPRGSPNPREASRCVCLLFAMLAGGLAFVGGIETAPPHYELLLAPCAPLALWALGRGPLAGIAAQADGTGSDA